MFYFGNNIDNVVHLVTYTEAIYFIYSFDKYKMSIDSKVTVKSIKFLNNNNNEKKSNIYYY